MSVATKDKPRYQTEKGWTQAYGIWWEPLRDNKGNPMHPRPRWMIEASCFMRCMGWHPKSLPPPKGSPGAWAETGGFSYAKEDGTTVEIPPQKVHTGAVHHFMALSDCFFSDPNAAFYFQWNPWAVQMLEDKILHRRYCVAGPASCVHRDTRLANPVTGENQTIGEFYEKKERPMVMTLHGPVEAHVPFKKGKAELFEFTFEGGRTLKCTADHKILTPFGWKSASTLSEGAQLFGYEPSHRQSISDSVPSIQTQDVLHYSGKPLDSQSSYSGGSHLYGEQLQSARDSAQVPFLQLDDVLERISYVLCNTDDRLLEPEYTHACQSFCPSMPDDRFPCAMSGIPDLRPLYEEIYEPLDSSSQPFALFPIDSCLPKTSSEQDHDSFHRRYKGCASFPFSESERLISASDSTPLECLSQAYRQQDEYSLVQKTSEQLGGDPENSTFQFSYGYKVQLFRVLSIKSVGIHDFFDLHVPNEEHYFAEGLIHHNSGKTRFGAVWGVLNWVLDPAKTKVLVGSTTKAAAKGKVWGDVTNCYQQIDRILTGMNMPLPSKWLTAQDKIIYKDAQGMNTMAGIELVPGAQSEEASSAEKVQGYKAQRMFFVADEFATMSMGLWNTIKSNLFKNPVMDFIGLFNPDSHYDVAGIFCRPIDPKGWDSINIESECWMGAEGFVRRLDGEKSPNANYLISQAPWRGLISMDMLAADAVRYGGRNTSQFYQMDRGFWPPAGVLDTIYVEAEIDKYQGGLESHQIKWLDRPVPVCGFDPAFVHGGDLAIACFGLCGLVEDPVSRDKRRVFVVTDLLILAEDMRKSEPKVDQMIRQLIQECKNRKIDPKHVAIDETGSIALSSLLAREWSNDFLRVQFGSKASDMPISLDNPTPASEEYANRASELWYSGKPLLRSGQFKVGNRPELIREMSLRTYKRKGDKIAIESKEDMRTRLNGKSPDRSDAVFLALDVCRQRLGLTSKEKPGKINRAVAPMPLLYQHLSGKLSQPKTYDWGPSLKSSGPSWNR